MTLREQRTVVVVGGGPAGLAAALEAQRAGLQTTLIEQEGSLHGPGNLAAEVVGSGAEIRLEATAWGIWGRDLAVCGPPDRSYVVTFDQLVLASGSCERPVAFPGWTLPGVMSARTATRQLDQGAHLGPRLVVAGYGGWVTAAAADIRHAGANVVQVIDASARLGRVVIRAEGDQSVERAIISRVDADWIPRAESEQIVELDCVVLAFGLLPENQLARLAGCRYTGSAYFNPTIVRDNWMRTSAPGVLVAGDAGGVVGSSVAVEQGRLAGLAAAVDSGYLTPAEAGLRARPVHRRLTSLDSPADTARKGLYSLIDNSTIICSCENVTAQEIVERILPGSLDPGSVIAETRAGMGTCQGRKCASLIAAVIGNRTGRTLEQVPPITPRPPVIPVPLGVLAERPPRFEASPEPA